jgi:hypothetical protein
MRSLFVFLACCCGTFLQAADRNWNSGGSAQWSNPATWAEGAVPTVDDNVLLKFNSSITISNGINAVANTVALSNAANNLTLIIDKGGSLAVSGAITDTGAGIADIRVNNTNAANAASILTASAVACREFSLPSDPASPQYFTTGYDMTLSSWINVNYGNPTYGNTYRQTNGTITIPNGGYGIVLMDATAKPTTNSFGRYILDGGTLKSDRIGAGDRSVCLPVRIAISGVPVIHVDPRREGHVITRREVLGTGGIGRKREFAAGHRGGGQNACGVGGVGVIHADIGDPCAGIRDRSADRQAAALVDDQG